jgi:hypothetical protein
MGLTRKRLLVAATESSYGTSASPTGTDAILVEDDLKITPLESDKLERKIIQPYFGKKLELLIKQRVKIEFSLELSGSGTAGTAPKFAKLIKACGFAETDSTGISNTFTPVSDNSSTASVTLALHADGQKHVATGCRGDLSLDCKVGEIPKLKFTFTGIYTAPIDASLPTPTYSNQATPVYFSQANTTGLSINGFSTACLQEFSFDCKNNVVYRELVGCTKQVRITDRAGEGKLMIEAPSISTHDFFTDASTSAQGSISFTHGTVAGNEVTITAPHAQFGAPDYGDSDGIMMLSIPFGMVPSSAGNDELSLVFA